MTRCVDYPENEVIHQRKFKGFKDRSVEFIFSRGRYSTKVSDFLFSLERTDAVYGVAVLLFVLDHAELFNFKCPSMSY